MRVFGLQLNLLLVVFVIFCFLLSFLKEPEVYAPDTLKQEETFPNVSNLDHRKRGRLNCQQEYDSFQITKSLRLDQKTKCKRVQIDPPRSCKQLKQMLDKSHDACSQRKSFELCRVDLSFNNKQKTHFYSFNCSFLRSNCSVVEIGYYTAETGNMYWIKIQQNDSNSTEIRLEFLSQQEEFVFIRCRLEKSKYKYYKKNKYSFTYDDYAQQLLMFPKLPSSAFMNASESSRLNSSKKPNINIMFFDSTSRTESFYALPKTMAFLKSLSSSGKRKVLDFRLVQSLYHRTSFHHYSLFNGADRIEEVHLDIILNGKKFFSKLKQSDFLTAYSLDSCYETDFLYYTNLTRLTLKERYRQLSALMESNKMDNIGFHIISCEILRASFNNKDVYTANEKCFNGQRLTELQMGHIMKLQKFWKLHDRKFVTFSEFNLNHNPSYSSIKHIDSALTKHLSEASEMDDMITILYSDHGNKWSEYLKFQYPESHIDQWHPFIFIILPSNKDEYFTKEELRNLEINQFRMATVKDLHYVISKFSEQGKEEKLDLLNHPNRGMLDPIPAEMFCDDIEKISLKNNQARCICQQKDYRVNSRTQIMAAKTTEIFLNNQIPKNASKQCMKIHLQLKEIKIYESLNNNTLRLDKNYKVHAIFDLESFRRHGVSFSVLLHYQHNLKNSSFKIMSFSRVDYFHARFKNCFSKVPWVPPEVCIC